MLTLRARLVAAVFLIFGALSATPAQAASAPPAPTDIKVTTTTDSATITWKASPGADYHHLCLVASANSYTCAYASPRVYGDTTYTFNNLKPTGGTDYYVRVRANNTAGGTNSPRIPFNLKTVSVGGVPSVRSVPVEAGLTKAWWHTASNAESYEIQFALNSQMKSGLQTFESDTAKIPVTTLSLGRPYWFRVRGVNGSSTGSWSALGTVRPDSLGGEVSVITYNLCGQDKCVNSTNNMAKWYPTRKQLAGSHIRAADAGIIATQESHSRDTKFGSELPGYNLAAYYSAKSLFYDTSRYSRERAGVITLDATERKYAVWGQFRAWGTGTRFFVADAHLQPYKGKYNDDKRAAQTRVLISEIAKANTENLPVVYAGDYNSNKSNANQSKYRNGYDAPLAVFRAAGIPDSIDTVDPENAYFANWNTANQAKNPPLKHSDHVDHVFATPDIDVLEWRMLLRVSGDQYQVPFASDHNPVQVTMGIPGSN